MAISTYAELKTQIPLWLAEDSLIDDQLDNCIKSVEDALNANCDFRLLDMQVVKTADLAAADQDVTLPDDYLEMQYVTELTASEYPPLTYVAPELLTSMDDPGYLAYYTIIGGKMRVKGAVGASQTFEMAYYQKIPALSASNTTNWLLTKAQNVYLYGAMAHACLFLSDDDGAAKWGGLAADLRDKMIKANVNASTTGGTMQVSMPEAAA